MRNRRKRHISLLLVGLVPVVWAVYAVSDDPRRAGVVAALALIGMGLNAGALVNPRFGVRAPLRIIACGVALIVLVGVIAMYRWIETEHLPTLPANDLARREVARAAAHNLIWIAAAAAYVTLTVLAVPASKRESQ
jgi:hypothetical protein